MPSKSKITLTDVAQHAGVSAITVSRALRRPETVSEGLRARISQSIRDLGYIPDPVASALASGRSNIIGVLIPSVTNNVFADVLRGMYEAIEATPYSIQLGNTRYSPGMEENLVRVFLSQKPVGLIVAGIDQSHAARALLAAAPCPVVQIMEIDTNPIDIMIGFSHYDAASAATEHLIAQGYRKPAFLGARMDPRTQRRFQGFRDTATRAGIFDEARVVTTPQASTISLGCRLFADLISRVPDVDAVFCNNDDLALGVLFEAQRRRISIPHDLGLCGFNNLDLTVAAEPPITSVRTFRQEMGEQAVTALTEAVKHPGERAKTIIDLGFEIQARRSTARQA